MRIYFSLLFFLGFCFLAPGQSHPSWPRMLHVDARRALAESEKKNPPLMLFLKPYIHEGYPDKKASSTKKDSNSTPIAAYYPEQTTKLIESSEPNPKESARKEVVSSNYSKVNSYKMSGWVWHPYLEWLYIDPHSYPYFYLYNKKEWVLIIVGSP